MSEERLQKFLARAGVASRRAAERLIEQGFVKVNGKVVRELGTKVDPSRDVVEFEGRRIEADGRCAYLLLHKPPQVISASSDPDRRQVVTELVPAEYGRLYPVGRLDWDSEGALLMTNDGTLTQLLTHPRHEVPKTYSVKVQGVLGSSDDRIEQIRAGVRLDDGYRTRAAEVIRDCDTGRNTWFIVVVKEGKNRQIRRMFEAVGLRVTRLKRVAYGPVLLGELPQGAFRKLSEDEVDQLYEVAGSKRPTLTASRGRLTSSKKKNRPSSGRGKPARSTTRSQNKGNGVRRGRSGGRGGRGTDG